MPYSESAPANLTLTAPLVGTIAPAIPEETEAQGRLDNPMRKQQRSVSSQSPQNVASYFFNMHATQPRVTSDSTLLPRPLIAGMMGVSHHSWALVFRSAKWVEMQTAWQWC